MKISEHNLINLINNKQNEGYEYLYKNYYPSLCNFCMRFLHSKEESEDIVQELIYKLWKSKISFYSIQSLTSYLYISARNASLNEIRKRVNKLDANSLQFIIKELQDERTIQHVIIEEEYYRQINLTINELSPERKKVIFLSMEGLSNKEIALKVGVSVNTVKTLKLKAYKFLRGKLHPTLN